MNSNILKRRLQILWIVLTLLDLSMEWRWVKYLTIPPPTKPLEANWPRSFLFFTFLCWKQRLRFVLETFMLRRTKTAELNGKPILTLPKRNVEVLTLEFDDPSEREFYESLEALIRGNIEKASEKSENGKINHIMVLTGLMRLRQGESFEMGLRKGFLWTDNLFIQFYLSKPVITLHYARNSS